MERLQGRDVERNEMRDTIEMAREAGADTLMYWDIEKLKRFEALVRADEREQGQKWFDAVTAQHKQLILAEREACAKVCESEAEMFKSCAYGANDGRYDWKEDGARECAAAIRARGNT
jgi:hypothetical protein